MPPFGNLYQVPVYVDRELAEDEAIVFQAGTHTDTMSLQYADFERLVRPEVADFRALSRYRYVWKRPSPSPRERDLRGNYRGGRSTAAD